MCLAEPNPAMFQCHHPHCTGGFDEARHLHNPVPAAGALRKHLQPGHGTTKLWHWGLDVSGVAQFVKFFTCQEL